MSTRADTHARPHSPTEESTPSTKTIVLLFVGLMVTMLMASLSQTILSTALPTIVGQLGGVEQMTWVITGYILASTVMMPVYGRVSDLFGRKPVLIAAVLLFMIGSVVGGLGNSMALLIIARIIQGLGGGGLMILSQSAIAEVVPARERGKYMGVMGAVFAVSSVAGPLVGGWLTEGPGWRWAFWLNLPLGVLAIVAIVLFLHLPAPIRTQRPKIDYLGMMLIAAATVAVVLVCTWGGSQYAWLSPQIIGLLAAALVLGALSVRVEATASQPVIPLDLFKNRSFVLATLAGLLTGVAMFGVLSYMPTYIQMVAGVDATVAGLLMIPMMGGLLISSIVSGQLVTRTGRYKIFPLIGSAIMAVALYLISTMTLETSNVVMCTYIGIFGIGLGLGQQILMLIVQDAFPVRILGTATASFNYFKQVGATIGSAIVGAVFASRLATLLTENLSAVDQPSGAPGGALNVNGLTPSAVADMPDAFRIPIITSYNEALLPIVQWLIPVALAVVVVMLFVKEKALSTSIDRSVDESSVVGTGDGVAIAASALTEATVEDAEHPHWDDEHETGNVSGDRVPVSSDS